MSRARPITLPTGETEWFDTALNGTQASADQLELLVTVTGEDLDDLLDGSITQGELLRRLREALDQGCVPEEVLERQRLFRAMRRLDPECRCCGRPGLSTRHHYVNKWIMKELSNYREVGPRTKCTVPVCIDCHRDLHDRSNEAVSIVPYLTPDEREFANALIERLRRERPDIFNLLAEGDDSVYEARLIKDWLHGQFDQRG